MDKQSKIFVFTASVILLALLFTEIPWQPQEPQYVLIKAQFHTHTTYSDGVYTPEQVVQMYSDAGFDCIAITDHNTLGGVERAKVAAETLNMTIVAGEEITYNFPDGTMKHIVGLFLTEAVVNSSWHRNNEVKPIFDAVHEQNAIAFVAHPWWSSSSNSFVDSPWYDYRYEPYIDGWEVRSWTPALTEAEINSLLASGYFCLFNHDFHSGTPSPNRYNIMFCYGRTEEDVKDALMNGRNIMFSNGQIYGTNEMIELYNELSEQTA